MPARPLIWPLLDRLNPTVALQQRPKSSANLGLTRLPVMPWYGGDRPGMAGYGQVEGVPLLLESRPWNFGLAKLGLQAIRLQEFRTNPRAIAVSEQRRVPAVVHTLGLWQFLPPAPPPSDDRQTSRIIWPLMRRLFFNPNRVVSGSPDNTNLRAAIHGLIAIQQRPIAVPQKSTGLLLPWARISNNPDFAAVPIRPVVVHVNPPARVVTITGVTRDSTGAILGGCVVELYDSVTNLPMMQTTSDATTGAYQFTCAKLPPGQHYVVAYKVGSPDVAGTTVNTLVGT